jgi:hypothetical protein
MKKVTITIKTENAAFAEDCGYEVGRILNELASKYMHGDPIPSSLRDVNGNTVGKVEVR